MAEPASRRRAAAAVALSALTGATLAGCSVGPEFVSPVPQLAEARGFLDTGRPVRSPLPVLARTTTAPPAAEWWRVFHDPLLTRLEARVADQNLDVRTASLRLAESRAQLGAAAAAALPTVSGSNQIYREQFSQNGIISRATSSLGGSAGGIGGGLPSNFTQSFSTPYESYSAGFDASWELDLWGRVRRSIENAEAQADSSAEARRDTLVSTLAELARDYVQLRGTQNLIRIDLANVKVNQEILDVVRIRQQKGLVTGLDTATAASQVESIRAQIPQLQQQEVQGINAISLLLAEPPLALSQELTTARAVPPVPPRVPIGVPSGLIMRRPDIRRAEADLHAAVAEIGVAEAEFFPTVTITGSPQFNALDPGKVFRATSLQYMNVGPSISIPIFDGGRLKSNLVLQQARQQEAAIAYQKAVLQAWHDVVNGLAALKADEGRRARLQRQVGDARQALALARARYVQGVEIFTTVLSNSQTVLQAEVNLSQATAGISTDLVALYKALGGGWETTFPDRPIPPLRLDEVTIPAEDITPKPIGPP
jgi:NodT family efflux transporter outer membrane factor (OMF) lipoprotein